MALTLAELNLAFDIDPLVRFEASQFLRRNDYNVERPGIRSAALHLNAGQTASVFGAARYKLAQKQSCFTFVESALGRKEGGLLQVEELQRNHLFVLILTGNQRRDRKPHALTVRRTRCTDAGRSQLGSIRPYGNIVHLVLG